MYRSLSGNPLKYVDPSGHILETPWNAFNVGLDIASIGTNIAVGNIGGALLYGAALIYDGTATIVPRLPAGTGAAKSAYKAAKIAEKSRTVTTKIVEKATKEFDILKYADKVSAKEMQELSEKMMDAAKVPESSRKEFYSEFNKYI